jgi:serine/threonine protein phosphatase 1
VIFAIGDIHGCANELRQLLNQLPQDPDTTFVFLGDYVDRGPDSSEVIDTILELSKRCKVVPLMGNHEEMFLGFLRDPESHAAAMFILNGGSATLASYSKGGHEYHVPDEHIAFLKSLQVMHVTDQNIFVHAGLPQIPLQDIDPEDSLHYATMLWTRGRFLKTKYDWGKVVVHGHTPVRRVTQWPNRINIDTGCVYDGRLTALALPGEARFSVRRMSEGQRVLLRDPRGTREAFRFHGAVPVRVKREGRVHELVTVDYSELGMYLRAVDPDAPRFGEGERIGGIIAPDEASAVSFTGVVVRMRAEESGVHYGIKVEDTRATSAADSTLSEDDSGLDEVSVVVRR